MATFHWDDSIEERKDVLLGKPVFKGTRLTVELALTELGAGTTQDQLLANDPTLKPEHLRAAMLDAATLMKRRPRNGSFRWGRGPESSFGDRDLSGRLDRH